MDALHCVLGNREMRYLAPCCDMGYALRVDTIIMVTIVHIHPSNEMAFSNIMEFINDSPARPRYNVMEFISRGLCGECVGVGNKS